MIVVLTIRVLIIVIFGSAISAASVGGQTTPGPGATQSTAVRNVLGNAGLPNVVDVPLHYKLLRVSIPAGHSTSSSGANGFLFQTSGILAVTTSGDSRTLRKGDAMFVGRGESATLKAVASEPAVFLHFLLLPATDLEKVLEGPPAVVTDLYRTTAPLPGLKPGPYEFTLTRVTLPPRMPSNQPHYRSGGALYYVLSGKGTITIEGKTETKSTDSRLFEPYGMVHQWANPGDTPLVLLQANISAEGVPAVIVVGTPPAGPK
jgi:quercetin dioxygenase-like cupin family protein